MSKMIPRLFYLPVGLLNKAKKLAARKEMSVAQVVRNALMEYLDRGAK